MRPIPHTPLLSAVSSNKIKTMNADWRAPPNRHGQATLTLGKSFQTLEPEQSESEHEEVHNQLSTLVSAVMNRHISNLYLPSQSLIQVLTAWWRFCGNWKAPTWVRKVLLVICSSYGCCRNSRDSSMSVLNGLSNRKRPVFGSPALGRPNHVVAYPTVAATEWLKETLLGRV